MHDKEIEEKKNKNYWKAVCGTEVNSQCRLTEQSISFNKKKKQTVNETQFTHLFSKTWNAAPLMKISQHNWSTLKRHPVKWTPFQRQTCYECLGIKIHFSFSVCCGFCQMPWVTCCLCSRYKVKWTHVKSEKECLRGDGHLG